MQILTDRWIERLAAEIVREQRRYTAPPLKIIGNSNLGYRRIGDTLTFYVASSLQTGLANDADAAPTYLVYEEENATQIVTSTSMALLDSGETNGLYSEQITLSEATGYEFQKDYLIYITATISSIASHAMYSFRIGPEGAVDSANAQAGAAGTITLKSGASATDDLYNGMIVVIIGGTGAGQARTITDYVGSTKVATIEPNWITNPSSSSIYALYYHGRVAVHTGGIVAASFGAGAIDAAAIATGAIDADAIADGAIDAGAIATGAIDADALATDAVNEIADGVWDEPLAGHTTAGTTGEAQNTIDDILADTNDIQTRLPATLNGGRMRSHVEAMDAGTITAAVIATDAIDADALATSAVDEIIASVTGTADSGSTTTLVDAARTEADTDYWKGSILLITSGSTAGQLRLITAFDPGTDTITVDPAFTQAISTNDYKILKTAIGTSGTGGGPTAGDIADAVWDEARAGHVAAGSFGEYVLADAVRISGDDVAADRFETMLDGTGGNKLTLEQLRINSTTAGGGIDIDNSAGPAISARAATGDAVEMVTAGGNGRGLYAEGNGSGAGIRGQGGATGHGFHGFAGVTSGDGFRAQAQGNGHGIQGIGGGTAGNSGIVGQSGVDGHGFWGFGDGVGDGMRLEGGASGFDLNADIQGNLSGSVGSVTGSVGSVVGNVGGNVVGSVGSVVGNVGGNVTGSVGSVLGNVGGNVVGSVGSVAAGGITAASIATDAIDADALAADAVAEIQSGLATSAAVAAIQADTDDIQTRLPASLIGGRMRSHVEAMDAGTITAAVIATGAIDADALSDDASVEILSAVSGTADSGSTTTLVDAALTQADTDYWAGSLLYIRSGSTAGQIRRITAFDPGTDTLTVTPAFTQAISTNDYSILRTAIGTAAAGGGPSAADIADAVWDEDIVAAHGTADTSGLILSQLTRRAVTFNTAVDDDSIIGQIADDGTATFDRTTDSLQALADSGGGGPTAGQIADAVWDELRAGHVIAGSFGEGVASVQGNVTGSVGSVVGNVGGNVVGSVGSVVGNVGGDLVGDVQGDVLGSLAGNVNGNVVGSVGSVLGNVGGNVVGTVASVVGNVGGNLVGNVNGNVVGSVGSVVGNLGGNVVGNVNGSVGSVAAGGITAASLAASALTAIEDEIWDAALADHLDVGSTGEALSDAAAGGGGGPSAADIADAVWDEALADHVAPGSMGANQNLIDDIQGGGGGGDCPELEMIPT